MLEWSVHAGVRTEFILRTVGRRRLSKVHSFKAEIQALKLASTETLRKQWGLKFRKGFPAHLPRHLLVSLLSYRLQVDALGDLSPEEVKYLSSLVAQTSGKSKPSLRLGEGDSRHQPGTVFVREYRGVLHHVTRSTRGFQWNGSEYKSLSAAAFAITGTKWNGLRFFGVSKGARHG